MTVADGRPACVAFDMVETTFSLEKLRPILVQAGQPGHILESWFAGLLRDAFALDTIGTFVAFPDLARSGLRTMGLDDDDIDSVIEGFATLEVHPDARPALDLLSDADVRVIALTNGSEKVTRDILTRNGLIDRFARIISIAEIGRWKPAAQVYRYAADAMRVDPGDMALFAAHPWDCAGAAHAGYRTGFVDRGSGWPDVIARPDYSAGSLTDLARQIVG